MSLLMDALRKAEQEKKAAAKKLREKVEKLSDNSSSHSSLSLSDDYTKSSKALDKPEQVMNEGHEGSATNEDRNPYPEDQDHLEILNSVHEDSSTNQTKTSGRESQDSTTEEADNGPQKDMPALSDEDTTEFVHGGEVFTIDMSDEAGEQTLNIRDDRLEDDTLIVEPENGYSQPDDIADSNDAMERTVEYGNISHHKHDRGSVRTEEKTYTSVSAQNVFAASKSSSYTTIAISILILLVIAGLSAYGVFYYLSVTPVSHDMPSPEVAEEIEATEALPVISEPEGLNAEIVVDEIKIPEIRTPERQSPATGEPSEITGHAVSTMPFANPAAEPVAPSAEINEQQKAQRNRVDDKIDETAVTQAAAPEIELKPELIQISRSKEPDRYNEDLVSAYNAFRRGDLQNAISLYRAVYENEKDNQDALLGLAAIAVHEKRYREAYGYYSDVLRLDPSNPTARAALINLQQQADSAISEAHIKQLLERYPHLSYLHYALGNVYSKQKRWPDAQQEYFKAYSGDSQSPDYALNLAISLDHMNKHESAVTYYEKTLSLADNRIIGFDIEVVQQRLREISNK